MMKKIRDTLAGRIGILNLYSMSQREKNNIVFDTALDFSLETLQARQKQVPKNDVEKVFYHIWEGGMPQVLGVDDELRMEYYSSYVDTYLMRDVAEEGGITDTVKFTKFLRPVPPLWPNRSIMQHLLKTPIFQNRLQKNGLNFYKA